MRRSDLISHVDPARLAELRQVEGFTWPMMLGDPAGWVGVPISDSQANRPAGVDSRPQGVNGRSDHRTP